jgi:D-galactarolactone cycloisomerase
VDGITEEPFVLDSEGWLTIADRPGLGVTLDREKIARYSPDAGALFDA